MMCPLAVESQKPANGAVDVETNDFIAIYFNKAIDPALLTVEVLETAHGKTYATGELRDILYSLWSCGAGVARVAGHPKNISF